MRTQDLLSKQLPCTPCSSAHYTNHVVHTTLVDIFLITGSSYLLTTFIQSLHPQLLLRTFSVCFILYEALGQDFPTWTATQAGIDNIKKCSLPGVRKSRPGGGIRLPLVPADSYCWTLWISVRFQKGEFFKWKVDMLAMEWMTWTLYVS